MPKPVPFAKGSIIFFSGDKDDRIFILQSGAVVLKSVDIETGAQIDDPIRPGEFFGVKSSLAKVPRYETASVVSDSVVIQFTPAEFEKYFGTNKALLEKMLKVFSKSLRQVHEKTQSFLKNRNKPLSSEEGMFLVAKSFSDAEEFYSACQVLERIKSLYPNAENMAQVDALLKESQTNQGRQRITAGSDMEESYSDSGDDSLKQFNNPVFDRFTRNFAKGDIILSEFEPGESFYLIKSGDVQIAKVINGAKKNLDIIHKGEFLGEMAILDNSQRSATAVARNNVSCLEFNKQNFQSLVIGNTSLVMNLLKLFCKRFFDQRRRFKILLIKEPNVRVADVFLMYEEVNAGTKDAADSYTRTFNLTINDVAQWTALDYDKVSDELNSYSTRNKIKIYDGKIVVNNIMDMKRIVDQYYAASKM